MLCSLVLAILSLVGTKQVKAFFVAQPSSRRVVTQFVLQDRLTGEEIRSRLERQLEQLKAKDKKSLNLTPQQLKVAYEDDHIIIIDKPSSVLTTATEENIACLSQVVFKYCQEKGTETVSLDQMVVHRLGMDTSGLIVFAKTLDAVRGMNTLFRTRKITRQYEALVCGHLPEGSADQGLINLPLMRDYEHPPFMRISTDEHQRNLIDLDPLVVGRKLLEAPKASLTHYQVESRENLKNNEDCPVTRLTLNSISGRTHQLNVHCAAFGHPIVKDSVYGYQGQAAPFGGLNAADVLSSNPASEDLQKAIHAAASDMSMCVHAKLIRFKHPVTKEEVEVKSPAPF